MVDDPKFGLSIANKLFTQVGGKDPTMPEQDYTLEYLSSRKFGDLSLSFKKNFRSDGYWALREITEDPKLTKGKSKPDPANECYAGQEYSIPLAMHFMRTALLQTTQTLDEEVKYNLYLQMCDEIISGPLAIQLNKMPEASSTDPDFPLFPSQSIIEEICNKQLKNLMTEKPAPEEQTIENPSLV